MEEAKEAMQEFVDFSSVDSAAIHNLQQRIKIHDYKSGFDFYFGDEVDESIKSKWASYKANFLRTKIDSFLNLCGIDPETSVIWDIGEKFSIDLGLNKPTEQKKASIETTKSRPWWKFW